MSLVAAGLRACRLDLVGSVNREDVADAASRRARVRMRPAVSRGIPVDLTEFHGLMSALQGMGREACAASQRLWVTGLRAFALIARRRDVVSRTVSWLRY